MAVAITMGINSLLKYAYLGMHCSKVAETTYSPNGPHSPNGLRRLVLA